MEKKLVVLLLNRVDLLEDVLEGLLEIGVSGATVLDSMGMARVLSKDVPIFAGIRKAFPGLSPDNKTILIVTLEDKVPDIVAVIEDIVGDLTKPGAGLLFSLSIDGVWGLRPGL